MSLTEAGPGLLGTFLTWEDLQNDFFELFGPDAVLGDKKTAKDIADGRGFVSRIALIENLWADEKKAKEANWPSKFAVKMVTLLQQQKYSQGGGDDAAKKSKEELWKRVHNVESRIYSKLKDETDLKMLKIFVNKPFTAENQSKGYLVMEFVENVVTIGTDETLSDDLIVQILRALAKFHSKSLKFSPEEQVQFKMGIFTDMFGKMTADAFVTPTLKKVSEVVSPEAAEKLQKGVEKFREEDYSKNLDNMAEILGMQRLLCHGDLWTVNMLFTNTSSVQLEALIDFQICHFGCVGHDLARLFSSVMNLTDRREKSEILIENYCQYLREELGESQEMPFTVEKVKESYRRYLPFASFIVAITLAAVGEMTAKKASDPEGAWTKMKEKIAELAEEMH